MSLEQHEWFYISQGGQMGPVDRAELERLAAGGELRRSDLLWREGLPKWIPASGVEGLFGDDHTTAADDGPAAAAQRLSVLAYQGGGVPVGVSSRSLHALRQTRPWVLFLSILGFVAAGFAVFGALAMVIAGVVTSRSGGGSEFNVIAVLGVLTYATLAALLFFPAWFLLRFGMRIGKLVARGQLEDLEAALDAQKSFWQLTGTVVILAIAIYALVFVSIALDVANL